MSLRPVRSSCPLLGRFMRVDNDIQTLDNAGFTCSHVLFCFVLAATRGLWDLSSPTRDRPNPVPLQWKHAVLTTGPSGQSRCSHVLLLQSFCWGNTDRNCPARPGPIVITGMSYLTTGGPGKERGTNKLPPTRRIWEKSKGERRCQPICPANLQNLSLWNPSWLSDVRTTSKDPESE